MFRILLIERKMKKAVIAFQVFPGHLRGLMDEQELTGQREVLGQRSAPSVYPSKVLP